MTHRERLVAVIKCNGKILRELDGAVTLPFGAEYSVLVKNLDSKRIQVQVSIDGRDAAGRLIIGPNSDLELERFIVNGNLQSGNKFKFIERTGAIEEHRGIKADDGLIRVEAWTERVPQYVDVPIPRYYEYPVPRPWYPPRRRWDDDRFLRSSNLSSSARSSSGVQSSNFAVAGTVGATQDSLPMETAFNVAESLQNDQGITVAGSESHQQFRYVTGFPLEEQSTVVVLRLRGNVGNQIVQQPLTVNASLTCSTCGLSNKSSSRFCSRCGTALVIV